MKFGYHAVYDHDFFDAIDFASHNKFDFVQFDLGVPKFFLDSLSSSTLKKISKYAAERNVEITFHAPGDNISLFADYPAIRKGILEQFAIILERANALNARHVTLHIGHYPEFRMINEKPEEYAARNCEYYQNVLYENLNAILANRGDVLVCVENYGFNRLKMEAIEKLLQENKGLFLALDIPKLYDKNLVLDTSVSEFMFAHSEAITEVHIHDYKKGYGSHQMVGEGEIDFTLFKDIITQENMYITFEIRPRETAAVSRKRLFEQ